MKLKITLSLLILFVFIIESCQLKAKEQFNKKEAMAYYKQQKHRFEIRDCRFFYNEKEVDFESEEAFVEMFGDNYESEHYFHRYYLDKPVEVYLDLHDNGIKKPKVYINRLNVNMGRKKLASYESSPNPILDSVPILDGFILFEGVLVNAQSRIEDINRQLAELDKYTLGPRFGNPASQGCCFDKAYCYPELDNSTPKLIFITLYYHDDYMSGELFDIQTLRYAYR